ncbi:MAG: hypothetical protein R2716_03405 [Microthrixaceae bacterium]
MDDVALLDAVIAQMAAEENVDPQQVYVTGFSNGAMMTYLQSCRRTDRPSGAASVAGTNFSDRQPDSPSRFIQISGSDDPIVPVLGGPSRGRGCPRSPRSSSPSSRSPGRRAARDARVAAAPERSRRSWGRAAARAPSGALRRGERARSRLPNLVNSPDYVAVDQILAFWGLAGTS